MTEGKNILSLIVEDHPGVLLKVTSLFARRGFNIDTITVGKMNVPDRSKMIITHIGDQESFEQLRKQIGKIIEVISVSEIGINSSVRRELALVKIKTHKGKHKDDIITAMRKYNGRIADYGSDYMTIEFSKEPEVINEIVKEFDKFQIYDVSRTGSTVMKKGLPRKG